MSSQAPVKISVIAIATLLAMPLAAQRYQGRDHHVFHPPVQTKHQDRAPQAGSTAQTRVSSTTASSSSRGHDVNPNASHGNDTAHPPMPSSTDSVHPH